MRCPYNEVVAWRTRTGPIAVADVGSLEGGIWSDGVRSAPQNFWGCHVHIRYKPHPLDIPTLVFLEKKEVMEPQRVVLGFFLLLMVYTAQLIANHDSTAGC